MSSTILRLPTVKQRTGLSRSTIYLRVAQGGFRRQCLCPRAVGWLESEVDSWLTAQINRSRGTGCKQSNLERP